LAPWQEALLVGSLTIILLPVFLFSLADPMKPPVPVNSLAATLLGCTALENRIGTFQTCRKMIMPCTREQNRDFETRTQTSRQISRQIEIERETEYDCLCRAGNFDIFIHRRLCGHAAALIAENDRVCCVADNRGVLWSKRCRGRWEQMASLLHLVCSVEAERVCREKEAPGR
jgi:hypothetical protein